MASLRQSILRLQNTLLWRCEDERIYAAVRIGFALVAFANLILLWPDRLVFLSNRGLVDQGVTMAHHPWIYLSVFQWIENPAGVTSFLIFSGFSMLLLALGILPRTAALVVFLWHLPFVARAPVVVTGWDQVLQAFSFLVLISPMGRAWSLVSCWRPMVVAMVPRYGLTLMRLQVAVIYLQTVLLKLGSPYWRNGEFMTYYLLSHNSRRPGNWVLPYEGPLGLVTFVALLAECAIPFLLFAGRTRFWGFLLGFLLHGGISLVSRNLEMFFATMLMTYLAFLRDGDVEKIGQWFRSKPVPE